MRIKPVFLYDFPGIEVLRFPKTTGEFGVKMKKHIKHRKRPVHNEKLSGRANQESWFGGID